MITKGTLRIALVLALAMPAPAAAPDLPPPALPLPGPRIAERDVTHSAFAALLLGKTTITFEKTRLADVMALTGAGQVANQGDAGESIYWLCYRYRDLNRVNMLQITAHGEMGGPEHSITDVNITVVNGEGDARCPFLPARLTPVVADAGFGLNTSYADFLRLLGKPGGEARNVAGWSLIHHVPIRIHGTDQIADISQYVDVRFRDGRAVELHFGQVSTY
jgi:hypothetical protein